MQRWGSLTVLFVTAAFLVADQGRGPQAQTPPNQEVPREVLVQYVRSTSMGRRAAIQASEGAQELERFDELDIHHLRLPNGRAAAQAVAALLRNPEVVAAQPNYLRFGPTAAAVGPPPNDPLWL